MYKNKELIFAYVKSARIFAIAIAIFSKKKFELYLRDIILFKIDIAI